MLLQLLPIGIRWRVSESTRSEPLRLTLHNRISNSRSFRFQFRLYSDRLHPRYEPAAEIDTSKDDLLNVPRLGPQFNPKWPILQQNAKSFAHGGAKSFY